MLENDVYVTTTPYKKISLNEAVIRIGRTLGASAANIKDLLTVISAYTLHFSHEELRRLLPDDKNAYLNHVIKDGIQQLVQEKIVEKKNLQRTLGTSKCVFMFQKKGEARAKEIRGGRLTVKYPTRFTKDKVKENAVRTHTYCTGMNLFQMLALEMPLEWERERSYPEGFQRGRRRDLQIDGTCRLYPGDQSRGRVIYFEQDMSTENLPELVSKLVFYEKYGLMADRHSMIVFSFYDAKKGFISQNHNKVSPFSKSRADKLLAYMEMRSFDLADEALADGYADTEYVETLQDMLKRADEYGKNESARRFTEATHITKDFLRDFSETLGNKVNPYMERELNAIHVNLTKGKIRGLATVLLKQSYDLSIRYMEPIRQGMQVLGIPTTLVSNRVPYGMLSWRKDKQEELKKALAPYFGNLSFVSERTKPLDIDYYRDVKTKIALRNMFSYSLPNGLQGIVCVEMPFMDLGAWVRVKMLAEGYANDTPISVVCILEDDRQAGTFFSAITYEHEYTDIPLDIKGICGIYGIYLNNLHTIIAPIGDGESTRLPNPGRDKPAA